MKSKRHRTTNKSRRKINNSRRRRSSAQVAGSLVAKPRLRRGNSRRRQEGERPERNLQTPQRNQSGDLTALRNDNYSAGESTAELLEEGQDLEGELVLGVGDASDADEDEVPTPCAPRQPAPAYRNRHRL
jgi:hypothetical protein